MPKGFTWSDATKAEVARLYREGRKISEIARETGLVEDSIRGYLQRDGLWVRPEPIKDPSSPRGQEVVARYLAGDHPEAIAETFGVGPSVVRDCLTTAGVYRKRVRPGDELDEVARAEIVRRYAAGENAMHLADEHGVSFGVVRRCVTLAGVRVRTTGEALRRHVFDGSAFDVITEAAAYWIGFLMADGSVSDFGTRQKIVSLTLSECDSPHVAKFRDFLAADCPITRTAGRNGSRSAVRLSVSSDRLADALARYGVVPRKSRTAEVIGLEGDRHFWRGVVDGDGSLFERKGAPMLGLVGSLGLMGQFREFVRAVSPGFNGAVHAHKSIWSLTASTRHAQALIESLYGEATVYLDRKMSIARRFLDSPYRMPEGLLRRSLRWEGKRASPE